MFRDPKNYTVQKALGADVFMRMFGLIIAWTKTNNNGDLFKSSTYVPAFKKMIDNEYPLGRMGEPDEVANLICFLCSDLSSLINGSQIVIDGGQTKAY